MDPDLGKLWEFYGFGSGSTTLLGGDDKRRKEWAEEDTTDDDENSRTTPSKVFTVTQFHLALLKLS